MGVPLSAVMAFWLASPIMDPSMFVLTAGVLDFEFAMAKTGAAIGLGIFGGSVVHLLTKGGAFVDRPRGYQQWRLRRFEHPCAQAGCLAFLGG